MRAFSSNSPIFIGFCGRRAARGAAISASMRWRSRAAGATMLDYGLQNPAAISANSIQSRGVAGISFVATTPAGDAPIRLQLPGLHNVSNALAAIAVGLACGLTLAEITAGLASVAPAPGRGALLRGRSGATLVDDTYNANPGSVRAAIDLLADCGGRRTLVLKGSRGAAMERVLTALSEPSAEAGS